MKGNDMKYQAMIIALSVIIPLAVAFLLFMPEKLTVAGDWVTFLPHMNGVINSVTSIFLIAGFFFIRFRNIQLHKTAMSSAFILGALFLVSYVIYHAASESTVYGDINGNGVLELEEADRIGPMRNIYLAILITHILLAIIVVPFVLFAFYYALTQKFDKHKKTARITLPVWLYVSISGVIVYLLISPYYT